VEAIILAKERGIVISDQIKFEGIKKKILRIFRIM